MKKISVVVILLILVSVLAVMLSGCGGDKKLPGTAWADEEIATYGMYQNKVKTGTYVVKITKLNAGEHALPKFPEEKVKVTSNTTKGALVVQTVTDADNKVIMHSETIMNGFTPIKSYKEINNGDVKYNVKGKYDGKKFVYSYNGGKEKRVNIKTGFMDNEVLFIITRCYEIESGYTATHTLINPESGNKEKIKVSKTAEGTSEQFTVSVDGGEPKAYSKIGLIAMSYTRESSPRGMSIAVFYTNKDFEIIGGGSTAFNKSKRIPTIIIENDIQYILENVSVK